jgi:hypothetical protein
MIKIQGLKWPFSSKMARNRQGKMSVHACDATKHRKPAYCFGVLSAAILIFSRQ